MALPASVAVAGWFVSPLISKVQDQYLILKGKENKELEEGLEKEIECLGNVLQQIKSITDDAEEKQFKKPGVHNWLRLLKDVLYDAEDVHDMYEVDLLLKKQRDTEPTSSMEKVSVFFSSLLSSEKSEDGAPSSSRLSVAKDIKGIRERLDEILKQGIDFGLTDMVRSAPRDDPRLFQKRKTTSYPGDDEATFVGRDDVKKEMIKQLVAEVERPVHPGDGEKRLSVLPIVGMGGLGKTTLAQLVFNDEKVADSYKSRAWVCVGESTRDLDLEKTTASIIDSVRSFAGKVEACNFKDLQPLQTTLAGEIKEPFLLVVDDAWDADSNTWDKLLAPLKATKKRCRVIVTTRDKKVADAFRDRLHIRSLDLLDSNSMWSIFQKSAFGTENAREFPGLENIGRQIVEKLKGLPLAAKIIGGILRETKKEHDWRKILESEQLPNSNSPEEDFMRSILMLSYNRLTMNMKQYFSCFSLFPKDYVFRKKYENCYIFDKSMWMIERVLFLIGAGLNSKDMTYDYVDGLLSMSLLQASPNSLDYISMHDLVHDLAELIGKEEFLRIGDASQTKPITKKIRHISFFQKIFDPDSAYILKDLTNYTSLRTLLYSNTKERLNNSHGLLDGWFKNLRYLRVLTLHNEWISELPDSIKDLRLLIYLDLFLPKIMKIPATISELCKLKGLNLHGCENLRELPSSITRLIDLIHLDVRPALLNKVDGIGKLRNLRELQEFHVKEEEGHSISELENMNELCGSLTIHGLGKVKDLKNAEQAGLDRKTKLESLNLVWGNVIGDGDQQVNIIEGLRPSTDLKELSINGFKGKRLPNWLISLHGISLHGLLVTDCPNIVEIPSLPRTLRSLQLSGKGVKSFSSPSTLSSLQKLNVIGCGKLDKSLNGLLEASSSSLEYLEIEEYYYPLEKLSCATTLRVLKLRRCMGKVNLNPTALTSLRKMVIDNCPNMDVVGGHSSYSELCGSSTPLFPSLESLHAISFSKQQLVDLMKLLIKSPIKHITIWDCIGLESFDGDLRSSLLTFKNSLEVLCIIDCPNLRCLPAHLEVFEALCSLRIDSCRRMWTFPEGLPPTSLYTLHVTNCPALEALYKNGNQWPSNIPQVLIRSERGFYEVRRTEIFVGRCLISKLQST